MGREKINRAKSMEQPVLRLLDANLNRCREGLRVLEDTARFVWNQKEWFRSLRRERHRIDNLTRKIYPQLLSARNSEQDEGRRVTEGKRKDLESIVAANFRRCEESLRVLEEYGKVFANGAGIAFKKIRFRIYDLEKMVLKKYGEK